MAPARGRESHARVQKKSQRKRDVWFFTEGSVTEPMFLDFLQTVDGYDDKNVIHIHEDHRQKNGRGPARDHGRNPTDLVDAAIAQKRRLDRANERAGVEEAYRAVVWCIFDHDNRPDTDANIRRAYRADVKVAFSHPCFELWRLLHYQEYTSTFGGVCGDVSDRLKSRITAAGHPYPDPKSLVPEQVAGRFDAARARAKRLGAEHGEHVPPSHRDPYTNVWELVEDLVIGTY